VRLLVKAAARNPRDPEPWIERGRIAEELRQWERAVADFGQAIARVPEDPLSWALRGHAFVEMGRWAPAAADFTRAIERGNANAWDWHHHALTLLGAGNEPGYRRACAAMLARFGETQNAYNALWVAAACVQAPNTAADPARLVRLAETAAVALPNHPFYQYVLEAALYRAGQFERAIETAQKARAVGGEDGPVWLFEAMAHHRLGHAADARRCMEQGIRWATNARNQPQWWDRLRYELTRREAEGLITPKATGAQ
jgi:tetratricopeptide (TPR) repeat protein